MKFKLRNVVYTWWFLATHLNKYGRRIGSFPSVIKGENKKHFKKPPLVSLNKALLGPYFLGGGLGGGTLGSHDNSLIIVLMVTVLF